MLAAIGVLLLLAGVSAFVIGLTRYFFTGFESLIPDDFKRFLSMRSGVYIFLTGLVLVRFF